MNIIFECLRFGKHFLDQGRSICSTHSGDPMPRPWQTSLINPCTPSHGGWQGLRCLLSEIHQWLWGRVQFSLTESRTWHCDLAMERPECVVGGWKAMRPGRFRTGVFPSLIVSIEWDLHGLYLEGPPRNWWQGLLLGKSREWPWGRACVNYSKAPRYHGRKGHAGRGRALVSQSCQSLSLSWGSQGPSNTGELKAGLSKNSSSWDRGGSWAACAVPAGQGVSCMLSWSPNLPVVYSSIQAQAADLWEPPGVLPPCSSEHTAGAHGRVTWTHASVISPWFSLPSSAPQTLPFLDTVQHSVNSIECWPASLNSDPSSTTC